MHNKSKCVFILVAALSSAPHVVAATPAAAIKFDIAPQPLGDALRELATALNTNIAFDPILVHGITAPAVKGSSTAEQALSRLLSGTRLKFQFVDDNTISVIPDDSVPFGNNLNKRVANPDRVDVAGLKLENDDTFALARMAENQSVEQAEQSGGADSSGNAASKIGPAALEEIIVSAQRREEKLQDVPISITVLSGADLDRSTADGVTEALRSVPGVMTTIAAQGGGTQISVRGVSASDALFIGSSTVGYYLDDVPFSFSRSAVLPDADTYDLARVEVLRGPQGTLYGASSLNGVVRILTHEADLNEFEIKGRTSISSTESAGENYRGDVAVNVPIISDKLAARAVLGYQDWSGWIDRPNEANANDARSLTGRLRINAQPTEQLSIGFSAWFSRRDRGAPDYSSVSNPDFIGNFTDEPVTTDYDVFGATVGYDFQSFEFVSTSSFIDYRNQGFLDFGFSFVPPATFGACSQATLPNCVQLETNLNAEIFSQEMRLASTGDGPWRWSVGAIYRESEEEAIQYFGPFTPVAAGANYDISESFAVFAEVTRTFFDDRLELTVGARYFEDDLEQGEIEDFSLNSGPGNGLFRTTNTFRKTTPRATLTWHVNDNLTTYASYGQGFRSGQDQNETTRSIAPGLGPVDPDTLTNYEWGVKGDAWNGRLAFEAAAYYIEWENIPQNLAIPYLATFITAPVNGGSSSGPGFEFATTLELVDGLTLGLNYSWNDLTFDDDVISEITSGPVLVFAGGDRLNSSPETTVGLTAEYAFPLGAAGLAGRLWGGANYISEKSVRTFNGATVDVRSGEEYFSGRAGFSINSEDRWSATLFADNITNEARAYESNTATTALRVRPRTIGVQLEVRY